MIGLIRFWRAAAVSCTGVGEDIVDLGAAMRVAARVQDGWPLAEAMARTRDEADAAGGDFAMIAAGGEGEIAWVATQRVELIYARHDGQDLITF